jgi:hypothetical protein
MFIHFRPRFSLVVAAALLLGSAKAKANPWQWRDPDYALPRADLEFPWTPTSDIADFAQTTSFFALQAPSHNQSGWLTINLNRQNLTLSASQDTVFNLSNLILTGGTLTLEATAGTAITINVQNQFSLSSAARIVLAGGLQATDVTFNILGDGSPVLVRRQSMVCGTVNALDRTVQIFANATVVGFVNAERLLVVSGGQIISP